MPNRAPLSAVVALYLANGGKLTRVPSARCRGALRWYMQPHPTHALPLALGVVGRW
jgi:hypothetical protein